MTKIGQLKLVRRQPSPLVEALHRAVEERDRNHRLEAERRDAGDASVIATARAAILGPDRRGGRR